MGNFHGISGLILLALAMPAGLIGVARDTPAAAVAGTLLAGLALLVICGAYCAKCPCRTHHCGHLIPGLIAQRLPARRPGPYTCIDLALTAIAMAAMVHYPQPWMGALAVDDPVLAARARGRGPDSAAGLPILPEHRLPAAASATHRHQVMESR